MTTMITPLPPVPATGSATPAAGSGEAGSGEASTDEFAGALQDVLVGPHGTAPRGAMPAPDDDTPVDDQGSTPGAESAAAGYLAELLAPQGISLPAAGGRSPGAKVASTGAGSAPIDGVMSVDGAAAAGAVLAGTAAAGTAAAAPTDLRSAPTTGATGAVGPVGAVGTADAAPASAPTAGSVPSEPAPDRATDAAQAQGANPGATVPFSTPEQVEQHVPAAKRARPETVEDRNDPIPPADSMPGAVRTPAPGVALPAPSVSASSAPAPGAPTYVAAAHPQPELANALARLHSRGDGTHELTVQLHPAELGAVNVTAVLHNGTLSITLAVADAAARAAVTAALPHLHQQLAAAGQSGFDLNLGQGAAQQSFQHSGRDQAFDATAYGRTRESSTAEPTDPGRSRRPSDDSNIERWL